MEKSSECIPFIAGAGELAMELLHRGKKQRFSKIMTKFLREVNEYRFNDSFMTSHDRARSLVTLTPAVLSTY